MRFINIYLVGYFILVIGCVLALWQAGILAQLGRGLGRHRAHHRPRPGHHLGRVRGQADITTET